MLGMAFSIFVDMTDTLIEPATDCAMLQPSSISLASTDSPVSIPTVAGFGCAKNFIHKVKIRPGVKPVQQKLIYLYQCERQCQTNSRC